MILFCAEFPVSRTMLCKHPISQLTARHIRAKYREKFKCVSNEAAHGGGQLEGRARPRDPWVPPLHSLVERPCGVGARAE